MSECGCRVGNPRRAIAVEVDYNLESYRGQPEGGSVDLRIGRSLANGERFKAAVSAGWLRLATHGQLS
ncbi:MAG: hypothetical protein FJ077_10505 [Cyanobacteria bacterium K_DeepCast_35m_m2_023]|nr:hypothetical protein [Cyanobacteria bacterium K_DeepCast_35m_m2_023]